MKQLLTASLSFLAGLLLGGLLVGHAISKISRIIGVESVAQRAVNDMESASSGAKTSGEVMALLRVRLVACLKANSELQRSRK